MIAASTSTLSHVPTGATVITVFALEAVREHQRSGSVQHVEQLLLAVLLTDGDSAPVVKFTPGVTGFETYYLTSLRDLVAENQIRTLDAPKSAIERLLSEDLRRKSRSFYLNAGGMGYDALRTSYGDLTEACAYFNRFLEMTSSKEEA